MEKKPDLLHEQVAYYRARAPEYDEWFLRCGRYDHGVEENARWIGELGEARRALRGFAGRGRGDRSGEILELACGTGLWTPDLAALGSRVTALDASTEVLRLNRERLPARVGGSEGEAAAPVDFVCADLFRWRPERRFDLVFFGFWLSHVPQERFDAFWALVQRCLKPDGRVFFVDSLYEPASTARDHRLQGRDAETVTRRLNDGREYRIVKVFHDPSELQERLADLGWGIVVRSTGTYFYYGAGERAPGRERA